MVITGGLNRRRLGCVPFYDHKTELMRPAVTDHETQVRSILVNPLVKRQGGDGLSLGDTVHDVRME